jgi:hypothetical protein
VNKPEGKTGLIILCVIVVFVLAGALIAYHLTGDRSIEGRFLDAAGVHGGSSTGDTGESGFSLEGNPLLYIGILALLGVACIAAYRYFRI